MLSNKILHLATFHRSTLIKNMKAYIAPFASHILLLVIIFSSSAWSYILNEIRKKPFFFSFDSKLLDAYALYDGIFIPLIFFVASIIYTRLENSSKSKESFVKKSSIYTIIIIYFYIRNFNTLDYMCPPILYSIILSKSCIVTLACPEKELLFEYRVLAWSAKPLIAFSLFPALCFCYRIIRNVTGDQLNHPVRDRD